MKTKLSGKKLNVSICGRDVQIPARRSVAIKAQCTDCSAGQPTEVRECPCTDCPLYPFRGYIQWEKLPEAPSGPSAEKTPVS